MLHGRVRVGHPGRLLAEGEQRIDVAAVERLGRPLVEVDRPLRRPGLAHEVLVDERQPMGQEAAPDDQHALVAQRREPATDLEQVPRVEVRHRHLEDRDIGVGVHRLERHPRAVVEAPRLAVEHGLVDGHETADLRRQVGRAGCVVGHLVEPLREPVEVVDQRDATGRTDRHRRRLPVRADDQDLLRARHRRGPGAQLVHPRGIVEERRRPVTQVDRRQGSGGVRARVGHGP